MKNWILNEIKDQEKKQEIINYENIFHSVAKKLMNSFQLKINDILFDFTEVEFYYFHKKFHPDCNVHQHKFQKEFSIYFHDKHGRGGVDIGFGDTECYGGILIRGIKDGNFYVDGPIKVADEISKVLNTKYNDLVNKNLLDDINCSLHKRKEQNEECIFTGPRVGLVKNNEYLIKRFRFITYFKTEHKFKEKSLIFLFSEHCVKNNNILGFKKNTIIESLQNKDERSKEICKLFQ